MKLLIRWGIAILALAIADWIVPGIGIGYRSSPWLIYALMAVVLALVNATVRPLLKLLSCPLILLTLGLFIPVINGVTLWLASLIAINWFGIGFYVNGFWAAFFGGLIISLVTTVLSTFLLPEHEREENKWK
jgi:putative membrane protein